MFIVSRPIRSEMKRQKITAKPQHALVMTWFETTSWLFLITNWLFFPRTGFSSTTNLFKNQTTKFGIDLEASVNCQNLQRYKFLDEGFSVTKKYGSKITNHNQLAWPFELHMKHTGQLHFWLVVFFSDTLSSLVWSYLLDSTLLSCNMSLNISFIPIPCT